MKGESTTTTSRADTTGELVAGLQDQVRRHGYEVDPVQVADAVLRDVAESWAAFNEGRARALGALDRQARRRPI